MSTEAVIRTDALCKRFGQRVAVDDVSVEVLAGQAFGLLGANGAGKASRSQPRIAELMRVLVFEEGVYVMEQAAVYPILQARFWFSTGADARIRSRCAGRSPWRCDVHVLLVLYLAAALAALAVGLSSEPLGLRPAMITVSAVLAALAGA